MTNLQTIAGIAERPLGDIFVDSNGIEYIYAKCPSGSYIKAYAALTIDEDCFAVGSVSNLINGIAQGYDVDARAEDKFFWAIKSGVYGVPVNLYATASATADYDKKPLVNYSASLHDGKVKDGTLTTFTSSTAYFANTASATVAELTAALGTMRNELNAQLQSQLIAEGVAAMKVVKETDKYYVIPSATGVLISATAAPISADFTLGDFVYYNGVYQAVTAVDSASGGLTAELAAALGATGALTATASGFTADAGSIKLNRANYQVDAIFK